jgi:predicted AAA+ superfamily ATPase
MSSAIPSPSRSSNPAFFKSPIAYNNRKNGRLVLLYARHADEAIRKLSKMFGTVLVTGARQVGKTTLLQEVAKNIGYVALDDSSS